METILFWLVWVLLGIIMLIYYGRSKKPVRNAFIGMATGGAGLLGVHFLGGYIGLSLSLNLFNTLVSLLLGIPGVILLLVFGKIL